MTSTTTDTMHFNCYAIWIDGEQVSINTWAGFSFPPHNLPESWKHYSRPDYYRGYRNSQIEELDAEGMEATNA